MGLGGGSVGVYVIKDGGVEWQPSVDVNQIVSGAFLTLTTFFMFVWLRRR